MPQIKLPQRTTVVLLCVYAYVLVSLITPDMSKRSTYLQTRVNSRSHQGCHRCNHVHLLPRYRKYTSRKLAKTSVIKQAINQSIKVPTNQATNQSINQSINQSVNQPTNQLTNQPIKQPINKSINQSINQPINQPTNQAISQ